jgi:MEDS: MEthanogen/methylotroph, DcmR Sensory domain
MADAATVDALSAGDHACLTFTDIDERWDLVAAFVRAGLRRREKVVCWTASLVAALAGELDRASEEGYPGLRVTADMSWAARPTAGVDQLVGFETDIAGLFADGRLCVICQYDRESFDAVTLAFAAKAHPKTVAAQVYYEHPLLRICRQYSPPGIRIAGELDYRHQDVLEQALAESVRLDRHMHMNLAGLDYIDAACAATIVQVALRLPASRRMSIICRSLVCTVVDLVGASAVPRLRVQKTNDQP